MCADRKAPSGKPGRSAVVIGGILVDDIAIPAENLCPGSSNPVTWQHRLGGVAANVACVVAQQLDTTFIGSVGDDYNGSMLSSLLKKKAIRASMVCNANQQSDRYTAVLNSDGELYIGLADARLAEMLTWSNINAQLANKNPNVIIIDANLSARCLQDTVEALHARFTQSAHIIGLAVSPVKAQRWRPVTSLMSLFFCNRREAAALGNLRDDIGIDKLADGLLKLNIKRFVITDGQNPILVQHNESRTLIRTPQQKIKTTVNGAGDALAGASIAQYALGSSLVQAVESAGIAAAQAVLSGQTLPPEI